MEEQPNYYAILPANVRYNAELTSSDKLFYSEITCLTHKTGQCWASNKYFSNLYKVDNSTISKWIKKLQKEDLIDVEYIKEGKEIKQRIITLKGMAYIQGGMAYIQGGYGVESKENNTSINNTSINNIICHKQPTIEEITEYCKSRNNNVDPQEFYDYYDVASWKDSNGKQIKNWKQKVIYWEKRNKEKNNLKNKKQKQQEEYEKMWEKIFEEEKQNESNGN